MDQEENWWFITVGKGNKERGLGFRRDVRGTQTISPFQGIATPPRPRGVDSLNSQDSRKRGITSTRQIRGIVQHCFTRAASKMKEEGFSRKLIGSKLQQLLVEAYRDL